MTEKEYKERMKIRWKGYGTYSITIRYRRKTYSCTSHNSLAYDACDDKGAFFYTSKQAYKSFWDECKRKNNLN